MKPGRMLREVLMSLGKKPATNLYPAEELKMPDKFRGKLKFYSEKCIGCKLCMKDCPTNAIEIVKVADKDFEAHIDLSRCIYCAQCVDSCPKDALEATRDVELAQLDASKLKIIFHAELPKNPPESA